MVAGLAREAVAVINVDDPYAPLWHGMTHASIRTFGLDEPADFRAIDVVSELGDAGFRTSFTLQSPLGERRVQLNVGGRHNLRNALAAAAAATAAGRKPRRCSAGPCHDAAGQRRLVPRRTPQGARLIDDSYNANPSSMTAGIDVLTQLPGRGLAGHGRHGRARRQRPARATWRSAPMRASTACAACSPPVLFPRSRWKPSEAVRAGMPTPKRWRTRWKRRCPPT